MRRILVFGSLNIDLVQSVARVPSPGETLQGGDLRIFSGGKGANQACAAARMGGRVFMAGMTGRDVFADRLTIELGSAGVDTTLVRQTEGSSGSAVIFVLPGGENVIVIAPGANGLVDPPYALAAVETLQPGDFLLCQLEIPLPAVHAAIERAHSLGARVMLDPAPASPLPDSLLSFVDFLTPNQTEAALLTGRQPPETESEALAVAQTLRSRGAATIIVKMGAQGCVALHASGSTTSPGFAVDVVDSTGAGDTFNGALAVSLAQGLSLPAALQMANAAAALSVGKPGAIASIPTAAEVQSFLQSRSPR